jgi:hypothetical protein
LRWVEKATPGEHPNDISEFKLSKHNIHTGLYQHGILEGRQEKRAKPLQDIRA